jgi:2'-5' RNA ligase
MIAVGEGGGPRRGDRAGAFGRSGGALGAGSQGGFRRPEDDPPGTSRLFIAVPVADQVRAAIGALMEEVAGAPIDARAFGQPRWVRVDGLHVTLRFLGATADERQPAIADALMAASRGVAPFVITLNGGGAFPSPTRPRVLWIGIQAGAAELAGLARHLNDELRPLGWASEERPFQAHLTLARTDGVPGADERARRLMEAAKDLLLTWQADQLVLYRSILGRGPARYEALATAPFRSS